MRRLSRPTRRATVLLTSTALCAGLVAASQPSAAAGTTAFGAVVKAQKGQSYSQALAASESRYGGRLGVIRYFDGNSPDAWSVLGPKLAGRDSVVSFRLPPAEVAAGLHDADLARWFATAPKGQTIWYSYLHEPEDNIERGEFTKADFRAASLRISGLAKAANNPDLHQTLILMCYTVNPKSGRNWRDYFVQGAVDVLGWDCYNHGSGTDGYGTPSKLFDRAIAASATAGVPFGIAELGSLIASGDTDGSGRGRWLTAHARYLQTKQAAFVSYFDTNGAGTDYRLLDAPSQRAWAGAVSDQDAFS